jgi:Tol biopolymer transport system component/DNA-binding winged helix-turn-helix (wHTH) protein
LSSQASLWIAVMPENAFVAYDFGPFRFEVRDRRLFRDGTPIELTPKTALLLLALLEADGHVVTRKELGQQVWSDAEVGPGSLPFQVHLLRKALWDDSKAQQFIQTAPKHGYRVAVPIRRIPAASDSKRDEVRNESQASVSATKTGAPHRRTSIALVGVGCLTALAVAIAGATMAWLPGRVPRVARYAQVSHDGRAKRAPLLVDRSHVYYLAYDEGTLVAVPITGGESAVLTPVNRDSRVVDWNPTNGHYLAVNLPKTEEPWSLWSVARRDGSRRRIGEAKCQEAVWSPRSDRIACATETALLVISRDGSAVRTLAQPPNGRPYRPRWSPDGRRLRFTVQSSANRQNYATLWEVHADGNDLRQLLANWQKVPKVCCGSWSPDGRHFVFASGSDDRSDLWIMRSSESASGGTDGPPVRLTDGPLYFSDPVWTADGRQVLAFGRHHRGELVRYEAGLRGFVPYLGGLSATWVTFSGDASWVAYSSFPDKALWRARSDGSERRQLTPPMDVQESSWSPDGTRIAFRTEPNPEPTALYIVKRDGGSPQRLPSPSASFGMPTWAPDAKRLAISDVPGVFGQPEGTEVIRVYDFSTNTWSPLAGSEELWRARWSPDGRYIAALTIRGQRLRLYDTQNRTWRTLDADHINSPTWSRDSRYVYYDTEGGIYSLRRVRIDDGRVEVLTSLSSFSRAAYWWSGLSPNDTPILLRDIGAIEIYALDIERD